MAEVFQIASIAASSGASLATSRLCKFLRDSAGWTIPRSGIGGVGPVGDNLGSGTFATSTDWAVMRNPAGTKEFLIARAANVNSGLAWYSQGALFTGGTGTVRATASDEMILVDGNNMFDSSAGVLALYAETAAPYHFYMLGWTTSFVDIYARLIYDSILSGSGEASDTDPYVWHVGAGAAGPSNFTEVNVGSETTGTNTDRCAATIGNGSFRGTVPGLCYRAGSTLVVPGSGPLTVFGSPTEQSWPIPYGRRAGIASPGFKGQGTIVRWNGTNHAGLGDTLNTMTRIIFGSVNVPWDGSVPPAS